jgi:hypothetical protein
MEDDPRSTSTGPTSPEGKARLARNAEKHGMYTNAVLLHYESAEDFAALSARITIASSLPITAPNLTWSIA